MFNISLNELMALNLVLSNITVEKLLVSAMEGLEEEEQKVCGQALKTFI